MAVGPLTSAIETSATSIAAGVVIGGFLEGMLSMLLGWDPANDNRRVVRSGHYGGAFALSAGVLDLLIT
jgi:hypothetical protein